MAAVLMRAGKHTQSVNQPVRRRAASAEAREDAIRISARSSSDRPGRKRQGARFILEG